MTDSVAASADDYSHDDEFLGHPKGLYVCFTTELWERFSFYGMKYLLVLYLTKYHLFTDEMGLDVLGSYAGLVYALPLIGGMIADRYLGMRKSVVFGGISLSLGHILMAVEGLPGEILRSWYYACRQSHPGVRPGNCRGNGARGRHHDARHRGTQGLLPCARPDRDGRGLPEAQHLNDCWQAVFARRSTSRFGFHHLLHGYQHRLVHCHAAVWLARRDVRLELWFRRCRYRHDHRLVYVHSTARSTCTDMPNRPSPKN